MRFFLPAFFSLLPLVIWKDLADPFLLPKQLFILAGVTVLLILLLRRSEQDGQITFRPSVFYLPLAALLLAKALSLFRAVNLHAGLASVLNFVLFGFLFMLLLDQEALRDERETARIFRWVTGAAAVVAVYGIAQSFGHDFLSWNLAGTPLATLGRRNFTAEYLVAVIPYCFYLLMRPAGLRVDKVMGWPALVLSLWVLFLTFTRASWIGFGVSTVLLLALFAGRRINPRSVATGVLILLLLAPAAGAFAQVLKFEKTSFHSRLLIWKTALTMLRANPLIGIGAGNLEFAYPAYATHVEGSLRPLGERVAQAHNDYLETAVETGLVGLAALIFLLCAMARSTWVVLRRGNESARLLAAAVSASLAGILVNSLAAFPLLNPSVLAYFFLDLAVLSSLEANVSGRAPLRIPFRFKGAGAAAVVLAVIAAFAIYMPWRASYCLQKSKLYMRMAAAATGAGYWAIAERYAAEAVILNPNSIETHFNLGGVYFAGNYLKYAREEYEAAYRLHPNSDTISNNLGIACHRLGDRRSAEKYYLRSLDLNPGRSETLNNLGALCLEEGRTTDAIAWFGKALAARPDFTEARLNLQMAEKRLNQPGRPTTVTSGK